MESARLPPGLVIVPVGMAHKPPRHRKMDDLSEPAAPIRVSRSKQRHAERGSDSLAGAIVPSQKQAPARCQLERQVFHELHAGWRAYLHVVEADRVALADGSVGGDLGPLLHLL